MSNTVEPSVSVLPVDADGRVLLVRHAGQDDGWGVLGGAVDMGESSAEAAVREAREEIGVDVELLRLLDALGGPAYEVSYPNGMHHHGLQGPDHRRFPSSRRRRAQ